MSISEATGSWSTVRRNVRYVGCWADLGREVPRYREEGGYQTQLAPPGDPGPALPPVSDQWASVLPDRASDPSTRYPRYADGPGRLLPSLEDPQDWKVDPRSLPPEQALTRCYRKALAYGKRYFALQDGGLCFGGDDESYRALSQLPDADCRACQQVCEPGEVPCGYGCVPSGVPCPHRLHHTCTAEQKRERFLLTKAHAPEDGGAFANAVYRIQNLDAPLHDLPAPLNSRFAYATPQVGAQWNCERQEFFPLSPNQRLVHALLTPTGPLKGLLEFGSTGSGKTCLALNVSQSFHSQPTTSGGRWRVLWVAPREVHVVPHRETYEKVCIQSLRDLIDQPEGQPWSQPSTGHTFPDTTTRAGRLRFVREGLHNPGRRATLKAPPFNLDFSQTRMLTYEHLAQFCTQQRVVSEERDDVQSASQGLLSLRASQLENDPRHLDPLYRTLLVVDEAHNLVSPLGVGGPSDSPTLNHTFSEVRVGRTVYQTLADLGIPGPASSNRLQGRDALLALLDHSYRVSGPDSAKVLLLSATPSVDSPVNLFWLLNLLEPEPRQRLSLYLPDYVDGATQQLRPTALSRFRRVAQGRVSYLYARSDVSKFARTILQHVEYVPLYPFHQRVLEEAVSRARRRGATATQVVQLIRDLSLCPQTRGPVYTARSLARLRAWRHARRHAPVDELRARYRQFRDDARAALSGWLASASTSEGRGQDPSDLQLDPRLQARLRKQFQRAREHYDQWQQLVREARHAGRAPPAPDAQARLAMDSEGRKVEDFQVFRPRALARLREDPGVIGFGAGDRGARGGGATDEETYRDFWVQDPSTGQWRLRREEEYVEVLTLRRESLLSDLQSEPELTTHSVGFVMRREGYDPRFLRAHLDVYCPLIHSCLQTLLRHCLDPERRQERHVILTFSRVTRGSSNYYGGALVASALQAFPEYFHVLTRYRRERKAKLGPGGEELRDPDTGQVLTESRKWLDDSDLPPGKIPVVLFSRFSFKTDQAFDSLRARRALNDEVMPNLSTRLASFEYVNAASRQDRPVIVVADADFTEGVEFHNIHNTYLLSVGLNRSQLTQFVNRTTRLCRSQQLSFLPGVGGLMRLYVFEAVHPRTGVPLYRTLSELMPSQDLLRYFWVRPFEQLAERYSVDYWLNRRLNQFRPVYRGRVVEALASQAGLYRVQLDPQWGTATFLVSARYLRPLTEGPSGAGGGTGGPGAGAVGGVGGVPVVDADLRRRGSLVPRADPTRPLEVRWSGGTTAETVESWRLSLAPGAAVELVIPDGVDLLMELTDLAREVDLQSAQGESRLVQGVRQKEAGDLALPALTQQVAVTTLSGTPAHALLGLLYLQLLVRGQHLPLFRLVMPAKPSSRCSTLGSFRYLALLWHADTLQLQYAASTLKQLTSQKHPSLSLIHLGHRLSDADPGHLHFLLWSPQVRTLERFDPLQYLSALYQVSALDLRLGEHCRALGVRYLAASEHHVHHALRERDFGVSLAFGLVYLHLRLLASARGTAEVLYPREFEIRLLRQLDLPQFRQYLQHYAGEILALRQSVLAASDYDPDVPLWCNVWRRLEAVRPPPRQRQAPPVPEEARNDGGTGTRDGSDPLQLWRLMVEKRPTVKRHTTSTLSHRHSRRPRRQKRKARRRK